MDDKLKKIRDRYYKFENPESHLNQIIHRLKLNPDYLLLVEAIELGEMGLRKPYLKACGEFSDLAHHFSETKKRELVQLIAEEVTRWYHLPSYVSPSLPWEVLFPTLEKWILAEPQNQELLKLRVY